MTEAVLPQTLSTQLPVLAGETELATFWLGDQLFGIPVLQVQDVLNEQKIYSVPLAPPDVAGGINLRGRIVTAIDLRCRLALPAKEPTRCMNVVVEFEDDLYSLLVDSSGDVMSLPSSRFESNPPTLETRWKRVSSGIFRLESQLLVVLDVPSLLSFPEAGQDS